MRNVEFAAAPEVCGGNRPVGGLLEWQRDLAASTFPETKLCALIEARPRSGVSQLFDPNAWDEVLRHLTEKLFIRVHAHARLYRLRGNRFGVMFRDADLPLPEVKAWLCPTNRPVHLFVGGYSFSVRLVTGLVRCPPSRAEGLLRKALRAARETKSQTFVLTPRREKLWAEREKSRARFITAALRQNRLVPYLQGIKNNLTGEVTGYECLMRIETSKKIYNPKDFIASAETLGLLPKITESILKTIIGACPDADLSVNLSGDDLVDPGFVFRLETLLKSGNFDPRRLTFEVLENVQIFECSQALTTIKDLKALGARIAIDDFGTVYSNLSSLLVMEVDAIKIDGLFVKNILRDERSARIVESITRMARESGIKTVAEFVENAEIEEKIRSLGIDYSQGYHIHRPEPMTEIFPRMHGRAASGASDQPNRKPSL